MSGLFTVLIAEKEHIDAIQKENRLFFEPFLENKDLAFCYWNPEGQSLHESVPGLLGAVGRRKEWRAVIIKNTDDYIKKINPFDLVDFSGITALHEPPQQPDTDSSWEEWENSWKEHYGCVQEIKENIYRSALELPLQKLSTWLCFKPEDYILYDVNEKRDVYDWAMEKLGRDEIKPSVRLEFLERNHYKYELRLKESIRREFVSGQYLNIARPKEVYCIAQRTSDNGFFNPDNYWNIRTDNEYSAFADRNMYFDKMRFMVFDLLSKEHQNFRTDYIRFLATVLIFVSNPTPSSAMQARRLYLLETETDDDPLCTLVTSYDKKLSATIDVINSEMERIRSEIPGELTDKAAASIFCAPKDVPVQLDESCDMEAVFAKKDYGLFSDYPQIERDKWNRDYNDSKKALTYIVKQQARSVKKSVSRLQANAEVAETDISRLTSFQLEDVRDFTNVAEDEMIASIPPSFTEISRYTDQMEEEAENVKKVIRTRMSAKTTIVLSLICLGLYFICFLPFLLSNNGTSKTVSTALVFSASMLGVLALIMFISLFFLRETLRKSIKSYNNTMHEIMAEVRSALSRFSKFLSLTCNVRRGYAVQRYADKNIDDYTKSLRIRKKHQEDIRKKKAYLLEEYKDYMGDKSYCDATMTIPYEYDFDQQVEYQYPAPFLAGDSRQIEFICSGNYVRVPSSYVTSITVRMEGVYDK